jgi:hypothetical protein
VADTYLQANKKTRNRAYDLLIEIARACEDILEVVRGRRACASSLTWYFYVNCPSLYQSNSLTISFIALHYYDIEICGLFCYIMFLEIRTCFHSLISIVLFSI